MGLEDSESSGESRPNQPKPSLLRWIGLVAFTIILFLVGRFTAQRILQPPNLKDSGPDPKLAAVAVVNPTPVVPRPVTDPPLPEQTLQRKKDNPVAPKPPKPVGSQPRAKSLARHPSHRQPSAPKPIPQPASAAKANPPPPNFTLPKPDYPTAKPRSMAGAASADLRSSNDSDSLELATLSSDARASDSDPRGEMILLSGDEEAARPIYHPAVVIDGWSSRQWLTVRFAIQANGRFQVTLLNGTGDPVRDAIALEILRQWRWKPKTVKRCPVASVEVLRLKRNIQ